MTNNEFYKMRLIKDNPWHNIIEHEYTTYKGEYKPRAAAVTYLMYSGMSHAGAESNYFTEVWSIGGFYEHNTMVNSTD